MALGGTPWHSLELGGTPCHSAAFDGAAHLATSSCRAQMANKCGSVHAPHMPVPRAVTAGQPLRSKSHACPQKKGGATQERKRRR